MINFWFVIFFFSDQQNPHHFNNLGVIIDRFYQFSVTMLTYLICLKLFKETHPELSPYEACSVQRPVRNQGKNW